MGLDGCFCYDTDGWEPDQHLSWPEALSVPRAPWRRRSLAWHPVGTHSDSLPSFSQSEPSTRPEVPHFTDSPEKLQLEA